MIRNTLGDVKLRLQIDNYFAVISSPFKERILDSTDVNVYMNYKFTMNRYYDSQMDLSKFLDSLSLVKQRNDFSNQFRKTYQEAFNCDIHISFERTDIAGYHVVLTTPEMRLRTNEVSHVMSQRKQLTRAFAALENFTAQMAENKPLPANIYNGLTTADKGNYILPSVSVFEAMQKQTQAQLLLRKDILNEEAAKKTKEN